MTDIQPMGFAERYGPWAVIAGASDGVGRALARQIAAQGIACVLIGRREALLRITAKEIAAETGSECVAAPLDLAAPDAIERIADAVGSREVGLYVSNAGSDPHASRFLDLDPGAWTNLVNRNVLATLQCCHHFGRFMRGRRRGGLLLMGSYAGYSGASFGATYCGTKAFELCFAEGLWLELSPYDVHVLCVVLGITDTPTMRSVIARNDQPLPSTIASSDAVAEAALAKLAEGPVYNWGLRDDEAGKAPSSAAERRARALSVDVMAKAFFGKR